MASELIVFKCMHSCRHKIFMIPRIFLFHLFNVFAWRRLMRRERFADEAADVESTEAGSQDSDFSNSK